MVGGLKAALWQRAYRISVPLMSRGLSDRYWREAEDRSLPFADIGNIQKHVIWAIEV